MNDCYVLGSISFEANDVRGPIPDKAYTVPMKTSLTMIMTITITVIFIV